MSTDGHLPLYLAPSTIRFCPLCGSDLVRVPLAPDQKEEAVCSTCGFVFYLNPKVVAGTIPAEDGRILLVRRNINPSKGKWTFPGGFVAWGETAARYSDGLRNLSLAPSSLWATARSAALGQAGGATHTGTAHAAVARGVLRQVLLMIVLGVIEFRGLPDLGCDGAEAGRPEHLLVGEPGGLGGSPFGVPVAIDDRAVLRPHVVALAHPLRRVVILPEDPQQVLVGHLLRVEDDPDHLGVPSAAAAELLVGRVG